MKIKTPFIVIILSFLLLGCQNGEMLEIPMSDPTCFHPIQEVHTWDVSGDGVINKTLTISNYYDSQKNIIIKKTEQFDNDGDGIIDDQITHKFSQYNSMKDYEKVIIETDISNDNIINQTQESTFSYNYYSNKKVKKRSEYRLVQDPNIVDTYKVLTLIPVYDSNALKTSYQTLIDSNLDEIVDATQAYDMTYDAKGKLLEKSYHYDTAFRYSISYTNAYINGLLSYLVWTKLDSVLGIIYGVTELSYNDRNKIIFEETREFSDQSRTNLKLIYKKEKIRTQCQILNP